MMSAERQSVAGWMSMRVGAQGLEFASWVVLVRRLDVGELGVVAVAALVARYLGLIGDWGAMHRGPRDVVMYGPDSPQVSGLVRRRQQMSVVLGAIFAVVTVVMGRVDLAPMALVVLARGGHRDWIALGRHRRIRSCVPTLVSGLVGLTAFGVSSARGAVVVLAGSALSWLLLSVSLNPVVGSPGGRSEIDGWLLLASVSDQALTSSDTLVVAVVTSVPAAGIYATVYRFPNAWVMLLGFAVTAAVPLATRLRKENLGALAGARASALHWGCVGGVLLALCGWPVSLVVVWILGPSFEPGIGPVRVLFIAAGFITASAPLRPICTALERDRDLAVRTTVVAIANLALTMALVPHFGIIGAAWATVAGQVALYGVFVVLSVPSQLPVAVSA